MENEYTEKLKKNNADKEGLIRERDEAKQSLAMNESTNQNNINDSIMTLQSVFVKLSEQLERRNIHISRFFAILFFCNFQISES